ncbi:hypothetical protein TNCV_3187361 [Trichonephila clavipes]|nr:hypothetical protein TNCV_3187361 [Trichonephila clavipes]
MLHADLSIDISSDLNDNGTTDGVAAWKILKDYSSSVSVEQEVIQLRSPFGVQKTPTRGKMLGIISRFPRIPVLSKTTYRWKEEIRAEPKLNRLILGSQRLR